MYVGMLLLDHPLFLLLGIVIKQTLTTPPSGLIASSRFRRSAEVSNCDDAAEWKEMCFSLLGSFFPHCLLSFPCSSSLVMAPCSNAWT